MNLMSARPAVFRSSSFSFAADASHLLPPDGGQLPVKQRGKLFLLECKFKRNPMTLVMKTRRNTSNARLWHRRQGHLNQQDLSSLVNVGELEFCKVCTASKLHKVAMLQKTDSRASVVGQRVFSDIQGPFEVPSTHFTRYALSFIDNFGRLAVFKFLAKKRGAHLEFQEFVAEHGAPKCCRTHNGGEYSLNAYRRFCREFHVKQDFTVPNTPQQNGVAERNN